MQQSRYREDAQLMGIHESWVSVLPRGGWPFQRRFMRGSAASAPTQMLDRSGVVQEKAEQA